MALPAKTGGRKTSFKAGGGQGDDVLSQVDNYIDGRPKAIGIDNEDGGPTFLQGLIQSAGDAIFGPGKNAEVLNMKTQTNSAAEQSALLEMDGVGDGTKPKKSSGVLDLAMKFLGGII